MTRRRRFLRFFANLTRRKCGARSERRRAAMRCRDVGIGYLSNPEVEHDGHEDINWRACEPAGFESPLAGGDDGLFVPAAGIERTNDPKGGRPAIRLDDEFEDDCPLNLLKQ